MRPFEKPTGWTEVAVILLLGALLLGMTGLAFAQPASGGPVVILEVRGVIDPVVAQYLEYGPDAANNAGAQLATILPDTPGGLEAARRDIVQAILNSDIPVAAFMAAKTKSLTNLVESAELMNRLIPFLFEKQPAIIGRLRKVV